MADQQDDEYYDDEFEPNERGDETFYQVMSHAPWWMISIAVHCVFGVILALVTWDEPKERKVTEFTATLENEEEQEEPEKEDDWEEEKELEPDQEPTENPVHKPDAIEADHNETDNNEDFQENKGENMDALADTPFSGKSTNTAFSSRVY